MTNLTATYTITEDSGKEINRYEFTGTLRAAKIRASKDQTKAGSCLMIEEKRSGQFVAVGRPDGKWVTLRTTAW